MRWIIRIILSAVTVFLIATYLPGVNVASYGTALWIAILLAVINLFIWPVRWILSLVTLGLFGLVLNIALFWVLSSFVQGFEIDGIVPAVIGGLILTIESAIVRFFI
jgi:putative membrane protein